MMPFEFGDVVLVPFPFTDQSTTEQRPAAVVSSEVYNRDRPDVLVLAISSRERLGGAIAEPTIIAWQEAALLKPCFLKPLIATIERRVIRRRLGHLRRDDQQTLRRLLDEIIGSPRPTGSRRRGASA
jgi:mRNA interferase MazF